LTSLAQVLTFAHWETKKSLVLPGKTILPLAILLLILLGVATLYSARTGLHLQDGMYSAGTDDPEIASIIAGDARFRVTLYSEMDPARFAGVYDVVIADGRIYAPDSGRGAAAVAALERVHEQYRNSVYIREDDIFAAYPLLVRTETVRSELDFSMARTGMQVVSPIRSSRAPVPAGPVTFIPPPNPGAGVSAETFRSGILGSPVESYQFLHYADYIAGTRGKEPYTTPSHLSPPLPFDSLVLIFVFIFPLYFISQFLMMSIMNERIERRGEVLLSTPARSWVIITGKTLPYGVAMLAISALLTFFIGASPVLLLPLIPVILFFIASGLVIGMVARSFRELSFISLFFSTVTTVYLFFPSIFADVHIISLVSPLTLMIYTLEQEAYTISQYLFSTSLFLITSSILLYAAIVNFREERIFSQDTLLTKTADFISSALKPSHPWLSLFFLGMLVVPFVFMAQMLLLVLVFNLPLPFSLILLLVAAAAVEEVAKSSGIYTFSTRYPGFLTWKSLAIGALVTAFAFLVAEKLLLLVTISQIAESIFGTVLFSSLGLLYIPFSIHLVGILISGTALKLGGKRWYIPGLLLAVLVHCTCNLWILKGWLW
jgi:ABC-type Na+ efflux pump permease subunit